MKIDSSRYSMFWANPERYRLREIWKLAPEEPSPGSFAALLTFGRRRGTCFHEFRDGLYRGRTYDQIAAELRDGGFGDKEIAVARAMAEKVADVYSDEETLTHECLFEAPIPDSPHSMVGRIDSIVRGVGGPFILDWKTSKYRPKDERARKLDEYCRSAQVPFYLIGAKQLGFDTRGFLYRLVASGKRDSGVSIDEQRTERTSLELAAFARGVHMTCELIGYLKREFGTERAWPQLAEVFRTGYESLLGSRCYEGYIPEGFTERAEHLQIMEEPNAVER